MPEPDPVARDPHGAALSAGELCQRDACWHRWFDHDHAYAGLDDPGFDGCLLCGCGGFVGGEVPVVPAATSFIVPQGRHEWSLQE